MQTPKKLLLATRSRWLYRLVTFMLNPVVIFVSLQVFLIAVTGLWVVWFINQQEDIVKNARILGNEYIDPNYVLAILIIGCILLGMILVGTVLLFVFAQRQSYLIRQQRNFVSSVTHELRSPLASLQLGFETLQNPQLTSTLQQRVLDMISTDISRLGKLVDQILVSARLDRGIMVSDKVESFQLKSLFAKAVENISYMDPNLPKRLVVDCPDDLMVESIRSALTLVVGNLLENAVKYSPPGTPIRLVAQINSTQLEILVIDQGFGLARRDQKRVFKMFHRSDLATNKAIPGTGLGLYIVRSTVRNLGGRVWANSLGPGQGSSFHVSLPIHSS